ncbi:hypothetical protein DM82_3612 [Burkholderia oklahomensis]|uniref:Uncharacterized protein n=1 Tax=Burkholderia oklahomensis TaxID=342113 RepID=A0AAI8B7S3_9BURK|nr:hypothetical protein DM82_3612 [Burkholderia oklahomensis]
MAIADFVGDVGSTRFVVCFCGVCGVCGKSLRRASSKRTALIASLAAERDRRAAAPRTRCDRNRIQAPCARSASREGMSTGTGPGTLAHRAAPFSPPRAKRNTFRLGVRTRRARAARTPRSRDAAAAPTPDDEPPADHRNRSARIPTDECSRIPARCPTHARSAITRATPYQWPLRSDRTRRPLQSELFALCGDGPPTRRAQSPVACQSSAVDRRSRSPANCRPGAIRQSAARVEHSRKTRRRPGDRTSPDDAAMMGESPTNA